ncbi:MAG TPA: DUF1499 domain-containing protein, partial [Candidatus Binataceae bacterium]|nr:DUF1499 domain-containing protein [Candidatus Binataceae bacterium]
ILIIIVVVFLALLIFVPFFRSMLSGLIRFAFLIVVIFLAVAGSAILMNNETIFDRPGWKPRAARFMTMNYAATSEKGVGDAQCAIDQHAQAAAAEEASGKSRKKKEVAQAAAPQPSASPTPSGESEDENLYDELMTRNYICELDTPVAIPRAKLLEMVQQTIAELNGWKLIDTDPRTGVLNITHSSRVLGNEDDIRIAVTAHSDVEICSQSKGELLGFFPGDFGANIGHIKEFYAALKPKTDQFCTELEQKQKPKGPGQ